jgi:two-component system response regulator
VSTIEPQGPILLVDDSESDVALTLRALRKHRLANEIVVARDGVEALSLLQPDSEPPGGRLIPRLIMLDLKLPRVGGIEVLRRLKADGRTRGVPVVVLTSSNQVPDIETCYRLGANSYIVKPVEFESFARAVSEIGMYWLLLNQPPA